MLTDAQARKAKPADKPYKLADAGGLFLYVAPSGLRSWRMKFQLHKKEKLLTFGPYPEVSLSEARSRRDDARRDLREHKDPSGVRRRAQEAEAEAKRAKDAELPFERFARAWHEAQAPRWVPVHAVDVITSLERDVFPDLGGVSIRDIDARAVLATLRKVEARGSIETARRLRQRISAIFSFAIGEGVASHDPSASVAKALKPLPKKGKQPAIIDLPGVRRVLIDAEASGATPVTKFASRLLALTAVRPGVIRGAVWDEFEGIDWTGEAIGPRVPLWRIPAERMKLTLDRKEDVAFEHVVPLSWQAVDLLLELHRLTGRGKLAFPSQRHSHRPLSENAIGYLYNRVGYHGRHVPHGWRAAYSTIMNARAERAKRGTDKAIIELVLAHVPENKVAAAYDRAAHMERRRELMQEWADLLMVGVRPAGALLADSRR
jgi:integrase